MNSPEEFPDGSPEHEERTSGEQEIQNWISSDASSEARELLLQVFTAEKITSSYSAPLPPAEDFRKYEQVHPGAADRIIEIAERSLELGAEEFKVSRRRINASTITSVGTLTLSGLGIWFGLDPLVIVPLAHNIHDHRKILQNSMICHKCFEISPKVVLK